MQGTYDIEGMHCESCTQKIAAALERLPGVTRASVSLSPPRAVLEAERHPPVGSVQAAVASAGPYRVRTRGDSTEAPGSGEGAETGGRVRLFPLILIVGYLTGTVLLTEWASGEFSTHEFMRNFMAGFFLVFSFFKFLDLKGFVDAYRTYDLAAQRLPAWGWMYPFVELGLGVAYLLEWHPTATNVVTLLLMLVGAAGVFRSLRQRRSIRCACLGTVLNLPMTTVTLVEDIGMAGMAAVMLLS